MLLEQWKAMLPLVATLQPSQRATVMSASHVFVIHGIVGTITHRQAKWSIGSELEMAVSMPSPDAGAASPSDPALSVQVLSDFV